MLSYQHEYHAGNHADLLKHTCLSMILESLCKKDKPFTVIDSHSGAGRFSLEDERSLKTGEANKGIVRLQKLSDDMNIPVPEDIKKYYQLEKPYLEKGLYAGSPEIERLYMRRNDSLFLVEKHPQAFASLSTNMELNLLKDNGEVSPAEKPKIYNKDSYDTLKALTPPLIKRGLVIVDPSYEDKSDYEKVTASIKEVHRKWNTAIIALWYPLLLRRKNETSQMLSTLEGDAKMGINPCTSFRCEVEVCDKEEMADEEGAHLYGSGMLVINPPWTLKERMDSVKEFYTKILQKDFM